MVTQPLRITLHAQLEPLHLIHFTHHKFSFS